MDLRGKRHNVVLSHELGNPSRWWAQLGIYWFWSLMKHISRAPKVIQKFGSGSSGGKSWAGDMDLGVTNVKVLGRWHHPRRDAGGKVGQSDHQDLWPADSVHKTRHYRGSRPSKRGLQRRPCTTILILLQNWSMQNPKALLPLSRKSYFTCPLQDNPSK